MPRSLLLVVPVLLYQVAAQLIFVQTRLSSRRCGARPATCSCRLPLMNPDWSL
jgi:hypothetical protein